MATLSDIQNRKVPLKGSKRTQTMRVRIKGPNGVPAIINVKDYNEDLHDELKPEDASTADVAEETAVELENRKAVEAAKATARAKKVTPFTRAELTDMSAEALRKVPEWSKIPASKRNKLKDKEHMVDAIINARKVSGR